MSFRVRIIGNVGIVVDPSFFVLCLAVLSIPFNLKIAGPLRLLDFLLLTLALLQFKGLRLKNNTFEIYFFMAILGAISTLVAIKTEGIKGFSTIFFAYKFLMPLIILKTLENLDFTKKQVSYLIRCQVFVYLFLVVWVFVYIYLVSNGLMRGNPRPSLPFIEKTSASDSPFYSTILWMYFALFFLVYKRSSNKLILFPLALVAITSALLTAGRSGVVLIFVYLVVYQAWTFRPYLKIKLLPVYFAASLFILVVLAIGINRIAESELFQRTINFNLVSDPSALGRVGKLVASLRNNLDTGLILGQGFFSHTIIWYDGSFSTLNAYFGLIGVVVVILLLSNFYKSRIYCFKKSNPMLFYILISLTTSYLVTNLISDYYLLTRSIFPFLLNFVLIQHFFLNKTESH